MQQVPVTPAALELVRVDAGGQQSTRRSDSIMAKAARVRLPFILVVVLPVVVAAFYFIGIAADRYETESKFVVRGKSASAASEIANLVQGSSIVRSADDAYVVHAYILSRDMVGRLAAKLDLMAMLSRAGLDVFWSYPGPFRTRSREQLYKHMQRLLAIDYDSSTGISTLRVQAFRPDDARTIAEALLAESETLINRLTERAQTDAVNVALAEVEENRTKAREANGQLTRFRERERLLDPLQVSKSATDTISKLVLETALARASLAEYQQLSPQNPMIPATRLKIAALEQQIGIERKKLAGSDGSLAPLIAEFERLTLQREFAERAFASSLVSLEAARLDAQRQHLYLERISNPTSPDHAVYPYRFLGTLLVLAIAFMIYSIAGRLLRDTLSHAQK
ncbi:MAG: capsule biosynthesis protein [Hyphomicrobiaceae bacterium]